MSVDLNLKITKEVSWLPNAGCYKICTKIAKFFITADSTSALIKWEDCQSTVRIFAGLQSSTPPPRHVVALFCYNAGF